MKYILSILVVSAVLFSCKKESEPSRKLPVELSKSSAFDSMNLSYNTFYRMAISVNRDTPDSNTAVKFFANDSIYEYKTTYDTLGLHLTDSVRYVANRHYSSYQEPDPAFYQSTVGYVKIMYFPLGGSEVFFRLRDLMAKDTFNLTVGVGSPNYVGVGSFNGRVSGGEQVTINFFR
jgi:hypothetical protein